MTMAIEVVDGRARRGRAGRACLLLGVLLLGVVGCADGSDDEGAATTSEAGPDATSVLGPLDEASGEPVRIGFITDGRNEVTDLSIELDVAAATTAYVNEHLGGIAGRPVEIVTCEAKLDPGISANCANEMVGEGVAAVVVGTVGNVDAVWNPLHGAGMPTMFFAAAAEGALSDSETTFTLTDPNTPTVLLPISVAEQNDEDKVTAIIIDVPAALTIYEGEGAQLFADAGIELNLVRVPPGTPDMVPQLQNELAGDPGEVHVLGNDSFCIAAFQALDLLAFDGPVSAVTACISDATRDALPPESLEGIVVASSSPVGADDQTDELFRTVMATYGNDIDTSRAAAHATFTAMTGLVVAIQDLTGEVTPETITAAIKSMPERELPDGAGLTFRCDGKQVAGAPAVCVAGGLVTTLDGDGQPTSYATTEG
jgi:branched-chain amino acid transport system substrate-binding protein